MGNIGAQTIHPSLYATLPCSRPDNAFLPITLVAELLELGGVPRANTPAQFTQMIEADRQRDARIIRERKITVN